VPLISFGTNDATSRSNCAISDGTPNNSSPDTPDLASGRWLYRCMNGSVITEASRSARYSYQPMTRCSPGHSPVASDVSPDGVPDGCTDRNSIAKCDRRNESAGSVSMRLMPSPSTSTKT